MGNDLGKLSDAELVKLFTDKKKSEQAFKEFYARYARYIYSYCLKVLGDRADAADAFQEAFTTFFNVVKDGAEIDKPLHYLMTVVRNRCLNVKRGRKVAHGNGTVIFNEEFMLPDDSTSETIERNEKIEIFNKALEQLPDAYRDVLVMRMYNGLTYKDIAEIIGESEVKVRSKLYQARQKIKKFVTLYMK